MPGFEVHGIDVSHHQGLVNWDTIGTQDIKFVIIKATEGKNFKDSLFLRNWNSLKSIDAFKGAYHFFRPGISPKDQFQNFSETVHLLQGDLPPVLDIEVTGKLKKSDLIDEVKIWLCLAEDRYAVKPIIYTYQKFYNEYLSEDFKDYPLWIARYHTIEPELDGNPEWLFWQYGDRGKLPGIKGFVDFNVFRGNPEALEDLTIQADSTISEVSPILTSFGSLTKTTSPF